MNGLDTWRWKPQSGLAYGSLRLPTHPSKTMVTLLYKGSSNDFALAIANPSDTSAPLSSNRMVYAAITRITTSYSIAPKSLSVERLSPLGIEKMPISDTLNVSWPDLATIHMWLSTPSRALNESEHPQALVAAFRTLKSITHPSELLLPYDHVRQSYDITPNQNERKTNYPVREA